MYYSWTVRGRNTYAAHGDEERTRQSGDCQLQQPPEGTTLWQITPTMLRSAIELARSSQKRDG